MNWSIKSINSRFMNESIICVPIRYLASVMLWLKKKPKKKHPAFISNQFDSISTARFFCSTGRNTSVQSLQAFILMTSGACAVPSWATWLENKPENKWKHRYDRAEILEHAVMKTAAPETHGRNQMFPVEVNSAKAFAVFQSSHSGRCFISKTDAGATVRQGCWRHGDKAQTRQSTVESEPRRKQQRLDIMGLGSSHMCANDRFTSHSRRSSKRRFLRNSQRAKWLCCE